MADDEVVTQDQANAETVENQPDPNAPDPGKEQTAQENQTEQSEASDKDGKDKQDDGQKHKPWYVGRIDRLQAQKAEYRRQIEDYQRREAEWQRQQSQPEHQDDGRRQELDGRQGESRADVERRATEIAEQREYQAALQRWDGKGRAEFPDFTERCNVLASMGAGDTPEFMQLITRLDDGHKVVAHLADHPEEAIRILNLPGHSMAYELGRLSSGGFAPKPNPTSAAPPPIKPFAGAGKVETDPNKMSIDEWMRWRDKQSSG